MPHVIEVALEHFSAARLASNGESERDERLSARHFKPSLFNMRADRDLGPHAKADGPSIRAGGSSGLLAAPARSYCFSQTRRSFTSRMNAAKLKERIHLRAPSFRAALAECTSLTISLGCQRALFVKTRGKTNF